MPKFIASASLGALAIAIATPAAAQDASNTNSQQTSKPAPKRTGGVNVIVVTAQKRSEDLQDVPVSVQAIGEEALEELNIDTFDDYLVQLPAVTAGGSGPGQNTIYIRGLASTTPNLTTAGVAGLAPNVALYLDEQPLGQPGRNLDVYAADLERIEVLSGPQGTLFGASSQAGVVRLITNKPDLAGFDMGGSVGVSFTRGGEPSYKANAMLNVPVADTVALRGVVYIDDQGGYIDNIRGTVDASESGRFRSATDVRQNGTVVGSRAGFQPGGPPAGTTLIAADNAALVEEDFNDTRYIGFRASALWEVTPDWTVTVSHTRQQLESDGVFFADPNLDGLDNLEIQRYNDDTIEDTFSNTNWTVEGRLGALDIVYAGAYTDRKTEQNVDYTDYLFVGQYIPYYICDSAVTYPGSAVAPADPTCFAPDLSVDSRTDTTAFTQELRFSTEFSDRFRVTAGGFYSKLKLKELNNFNYPTAQLTRGYDGVTTGFVPNYPLTNPNAPPGPINNADAPEGYFSDPGPFAPETIFRNDILRTDEQFGIFGEAAFDIIPDTLTITGGLRYYDVAVDLVGSANSSFFNRADITTVDVQRAGTNLSAQFAPNNPNGYPDKARAEGVIFKGTLTYTPTEDLLFYGTYSEGFRPGLLNRPVGAGGQNGFTVPAELETDEVKNYEIGWKTQLADRQIRLNGSAFYVDISRLQTGILDPSIVNLFFSANAADARIFGIEADFTIAPYALPGLTVTGAFSVLDTKITKVLIPTGDVIAGEELAYAPAFQGNLRARYEFGLSDTLDAYVQPQIAYSSEKNTDIIEINKLRLNDYFIADFAAGIETRQYTVEAFVQNVFDERAEISGNFTNDRPRITTNRPRTIGLRVTFDY